MKQVFKYFFLSRILFFIFALGSTSLFTLQEGYLGKEHFPQEPYMVWIWANFDGRHFSDIVISGYRDFNYAFFPLYPLLIRLLDYHLIFDPPYVGIFLSVLTFLGSLWVLYKIIRFDFSNKIALIALLLISFFPLSFFYHSMYADSLFLLLSASSFYFARRGHWLWAGIFGGLTTSARLAGIALLPALLVEWYLQNKIVVRHWQTHIIPFLKTGFVALILTSLGFISYLVYLQIVHGDFLLFQKAMVAWRQNEFIFPPQVIFRYLKIFWLVDKSTLIYWVALLEFVSMIIYFALTWFVAKKVRLSYGVLMLFIFLLPTFTGTFAGMPRYILHTFPAFIGIALLLEKRKLAKVLILIMFLILGFIFTGLFTRGYFIA